MPSRRLDLLVSDAVLSGREVSMPPRATRGWLRLVQDHIMSAHLGADLDFLVGDSATLSHGLSAEP